MLLLVICPAWAIWLSSWIGFYSRLASTGGSHNPNLTNVETQSPWLMQVYSGCAAGRAQQVCRALRYKRRQRGLQSLRSLQLLDQLEASFDTHGMTSNKALTTQVCEVEHNPGGQVSRNRARFTGACHHQPASNVRVTQPCASRTRHDPSEMSRSL